MVALDEVAYEAEVDYREVTKEIIRRCLTKLGVTHAQFAQALWAELEGSGRRPTNEVQVSKWASGADLPKSDVLLAALKLAGIPPEELMTRLDTMDSMRGRYSSLEARVAEQEKLIQRLLRFAPDDVKQ